MHRPFYSLVILLEIFAVSLFLVGSAHSQTGIPAWNAASGAAHGCGWLWQGTSGQEIRRNCLEAYRTLRNGSYVWRLQTADQIREPLPWQLADEAVVATVEITATGYDGAYDFAMLEGQYDDVERSQFDIAVTQPASRVDLDPLPVYAITCPGPASYFDDMDCCLDAGFDRWTYETPRTYPGAQSSDTTWGECEADGWVDAPALPQLDAAAARQAWAHLGVALARSMETVGSVWQSYSAPFTRPTTTVEQRHLTDAEAKLAWEQLKVAAARTGEVVQIAWASSWRPFLHPSLVAQTRNFSLDDITLPKPTFPVASTISLSEGQQIVVLTQAAATLDQLGMYLQEAAQKLRYIAADRIVKQGNYRRIAREGNR